MVSIDSDLEFLAHWSQWDWDFNIKVLLLLQSYASCKATSVEGGNLFLIKLTDFSIISLTTDCNKRWCTLESGFLSYYENDKATTPNGMLDINEVICLVVHNSEYFLNRGYVPKLIIQQINLDMSRFLL